MIDREQILGLALFDGIEGEQLSVALAAFRPFEIGAGEVLMEEGEEDRSLMVVVDGELGVSLGDIELARIGAGETVGEMTLFGSFGRRSATVTTLVGPTQLLIADEDAVRFLRVQDNPMARVLEMHALQNLSARLRDTDYRIARIAAGQTDGGLPQRGFLSRIADAVGLSRPRGRAPTALEVLLATPGFSTRDPQALANIAARLEVVAYAAGAPVVEEGQAGDDAFIVAAGHIAVTCRTDTGRAERVATLGPGSLFGHASPLDSRVRSATCRALEPLYLARIPGGVYRQLVLEQTAEGRALRRGVIDGLAAQLRLANEYFVAIAARA